MELKEIALAAAMETDEYLATKIAAPESWCEIRDQELCKRFLAAVDAERGKVVGEVFNLPGTMGGFTTCAFRSVDVPAGSKLFLSPTIPLGFALVPIDQSEEWITKVVRVNQPDLDIGCRAWREEVESLEYWHKAITKSAGVTK